MVNQEPLRSTLKNICLLQPSYSSKNTIEMQKRGVLIRKDLVHDIRSFEHIISNELGEFGNDVIVQASDGIGRKTEAPWVRFASKRMSPDPREGYYFVIHFNRDGTVVFLTIGCGSTVWKDGSLTPLSAEELEKKTTFARRVIMDANNSLGSYVDKIELFAKAPLTKSFELATATAKKISFNSIDKTDFVSLIREGAYQLYNIYSEAIIGADLSEDLQQQFQIQKIINPSASYGGQGFNLSGAERKEVELRAMTVASEWFSKRGYHVKDTSHHHPYDLEIKRDGVTEKVEVKGSTSTSLDSFMMTANEVSLHQSENGKTHLVLVSNIKLEKGDPPEAWGGDIEVLSSWDINSWNVVPTVYRISTKGDK